GIRFSMDSSVRHEPATKQPERPHEARARPGKPMRICNFEVGPRAPLFVIAGPDSLEGEQMAVDTAGALREMTRELGIGYIFKGSFDKANRTSHKSYRGPGL